MTPTATAAGSSSKTRSRRRAIRADAGTLSVCTSNAIPAGTESTAIESPSDEVSPKLSAAFTSAV
jgi:hypothetical protein